VRPRACVVHDSTRRSGSLRSSSTRQLRHFDDGNTGGEPIVRRRLELIRSGWRRGSACSRKNIKQIHLRGFFSSITPHVAAAVIPPSATSSKTSSGVPIGVIRHEQICGSSCQRLQQELNDLFEKIVKLKPYACGTCGPHQAAFHAPGLPRSCSIRLPVALLLENMAKLRYGFHLHFFGQRPAFFGKSLTVAWTAP